MMRLVAILVSLSLAGCLAPAVELNETSNWFPLHHEIQSAEYPNFDNLVVQGVLAGGGSDVSLNAVARNTGPRTYKVNSFCNTPWRDSISSSLGEVHRTEPTVYCDALNLKEFRPGESLSWEGKWNGTLWDFEKLDYVDAAPGTYSWLLSFHAYEGGDEKRQFDTEDWIKVRFTVWLQS